MGPVDGRAHLYRVVDRTRRARHPRARGNIGRIRMGAELSGAERDLRALYAALAGFYCWPASVWDADAATLLAHPADALECLRGLVAALPPESPPRPAPP